MNWKITYTNTKGVILVVIYKASSVEAARNMFNMLTSYRNEDSIISIELTD